MFHHINVDSTDQSQYEKLQNGGTPLADITAMGGAFRAEALARDAACLAGSTAAARAVAAAGGGDLYGDAATAHGSRRLGTV